MVKRDLAKVETAGPSPVARSGLSDSYDRCGGLAKRLGSGLQSRLGEFDSRAHLAKNLWAIGAAASALP